MKMYGGTTVLCWALCLSMSVGAFLNEASPRADFHTKAKKLFSLVSHNAAASDTSETAYDVVVIGSGISGLIAGNYLVNAGYRVLLVEDHSIPGGYTTNFRRGKFRFDVSNHIINGCERNGFFGKCLQKIGEANYKGFKKLDYFTRWVDTTVGVDSKLSFNMNEFMKQLIEAFPLEETGIRNYFRLYSDITGFALKFASLGGPRRILLGLKRPRLLFRLLRLNGKTGADIIDPLVADEGCRRMMTCTAPYLGMHYAVMDALTVLAMEMHLRLPGEGGFYPIGGSGQLTSYLAQRFQEKGGELLLKTRATEILFHNDRATAVRTLCHRTGCSEAFSTKSVVVASNQKSLVDEMCPRGTFPSRYRDSVHAQQPGTSLVIVWVGLKVDVKEEWGVSETEIMRLERTIQDGPAYLDNITKTANYADLALSAVTVYSNIDPSCCPPGKSVISTQFLADYDVFSRALGPGGAHGREYLDLKKNATDGLMTSMARAMNVTVSDLWRNVEVIEAATPVTMHEYTNNLQGAFVGWKPIPEQGMFHKVSQKTPIDNIFLCGQWCGDGKGVAGCAKTGVDAGELVDRFLKRGRLYRILTACRRHFF
eukprot:scaffold36975_cov221-Amphora_coffeaeformis.AAC.7